MGKGIVSYGFILIPRVTTYKSMHMISCKCFNVGFIQWIKALIVSYGLIHTTHYNLQEHDF
eukprot:Pgem_evm1s20319